MWARPSPACWRQTSKNSSCAEAGPGRDVPSRLAGGDDVRVGADRDPDLVRPLLVSSSSARVVGDRSTIVPLVDEPVTSWRAHPCAEITLKQMHLSVRHSLPPPVADRERDQRGAAAIGRRWCPAAGRARRGYGPPWASNNARSSSVNSWRALAIASWSSPASKCSSGVPGSLGS
jgi:hypothetical protein